MKVLFVDQFSDVGGAQLCLLELLPAVLDRGWTVHVLIPGEGRFAERLATIGVESSFLPCGPYRCGGKSAADFVRFGTDITNQIRTIQRHDFDLIYVNGPRLLPAAALAAGGRAVLFHAHNYLSQSYANRLARWSLRHSGATVIACSRFTAQPYAGCEIHVIPSGTPDMGFRRRAFDPARLRIGVIGKLCRQKGQTDFLRAARLIAREYPHTRFVICGDGEEEAMLRRTAQGLAVEFYGWRNDIAAVLSELDLLAIPSRQEGLSRVMLEAFSAGVPVIAYADGGIPEIVEDGETGFLVPQCSAEALASRICRLNEGLPFVAAAARHRWEREFTIANYQTRVLEVMRRAECGVTLLRQHTA